MQNPTIGYDTRMVKANGEWLNTRDLYIQYTDVQSFPAAAITLMRKFGFIFDDCFWYWITRNGLYVRRAPLWLSKHGACAEKPKRYA